MSNFNFKVSVAQLISLLLFTPLIMIVCKKYERFTMTDLQMAQVNPSLANFVKVYVWRGSQCIASINHGQCSFSWLTVIGYVGGVCAL